MRRAIGVGALISLGMLVVTLVGCGDQSGSPQAAGSDEAFCTAVGAITQDLGALGPAEFAEAGDRLLAVTDQAPAGVRADLVVTAEGMRDLGPSADDLADGRISENDFTDLLQQQFTDPDFLAASERVGAVVASDCDLPPADAVAGAALETEMFCDRFESEKYGEDYADHPGPTAVTVVRTSADAAEWYHSIDALEPTELRDQMAAIRSFHAESASGERVPAGIADAGNQARRDLQRWLHQNCDLEYSIEKL